MKSRLIVSTVAAAALAAHMLPAQSCTVSTLVTVLDRKSNQAIDDLTANDFHAKVHGHEISVLSVKKAASERRVLFVLDRSRSMNENVQMEGIGSFNGRHLVTSILEDALPAIPATDSVAFLGFSGDFSTQTGFADPGSPVEKARKVLDWSPAGEGNKGRTRLWDNIDAALRMFESPRQGDMIIVVSDGGDNQSRLHQEDVRNELLKAGVPVVAMVLADPFAVRPEERAGMAYLLDLAKATGGEGLVTGQPNLLPYPDVVLGLHPSELIRQLAHQYVIELAMPATRKPEKWQLEVTTSSAPRGTRVFYPRQVSCGD